MNLLAPRRFVAVLVLLGVGVSAALALRGLPLPDEGAMLTNAAKILRGAVFYRDLDAYPFPAATYALALSMRIFGEHFTVARVLAAALYLVSLVGLYTAAVAVLDLRRAALFGVLVVALKPLVWPAFTLFLYSEFAFAFGCAALAVLLGPGERGRVRWGLAGLCVGMTVMSKQSLGIYLGLACLALAVVPDLLVGGPRDPWRERLSRVGAFVAGGAAVVLPFLGYFATQGVLGSLLESGLVRPFTGYLPTSGVSFLPPLAWWQLGAIANGDASPYYLPLYPLLAARAVLGNAGALLVEVAVRALYTSVALAVLLAGSSWRRREPARASRALELCVLGAPFVVSAWPRVDFYHLASIYPVVLLVLLAVLRPGADAAPRRPFALASLTAATAVLAFGVAWWQIARQPVRLELERAEAWVSEDQRFVGPLLAGVRERVAPEASFFVYGHEAQYYFLADRYFAWPFAQLYPGQTGPEGGARLGAALRRDDPAVVLRGFQHTPGLPGLAYDAPELARVLQARYEPDPGFFREMQAAGVERPEPVLLEMLRRRRAPALRVPR